MFMRAVHPGEVLVDELEESGISPTEFARQIRVPPNRVGQIIAGKRSVTGDSALRFDHWFGVKSAVPPAPSIPPAPVPARCPCERGSQERSHDECIPRRTDSTASLPCPAG